MKIHNIRFGFATNSSSSHSIIFDPLNYQRYSDDYDDNFGWDFFTLASKEAKDLYIRETLISNLSKDRFTESLINIILKGLNLEYPEFSDIYGIDHQSLYLLPKEYGSKQISMEFFNEFREYILKDGIVILGGNDNDDIEHPSYDESKLINLGGYEADSGNWSCRKDGDWWTLFEKLSGNRIVLSFKDTPEPFAPKTPMLIDYKVTNWCDIGCQFCYQGSTKSGEHMTRDNMFKILDDISKAKVQEIALGGGETTKCPEFINIIRILYEKGITVNFTTKSTDWLEDDNTARQIIPYIGAFAYSADNIVTLNRIMDIVKYRKYSYTKFNVQLIPAVLSDYRLKEILTWCSENYIRVTLLGFKETGRGAKFKEIAINRAYDKFDESKFIDVIKELSKEHKCPMLAIDTTLAGRYEHLLEENNIPKYLYHIQEGKYSAYIDGVDMKFGPSSYHLDQLIDYPKNYSNNTIETLFSQITPV